MLPRRKYTCPRCRNFLGLSGSIPVPSPFSKTIHMGKACHHTILIFTTADRANSAVCGVADSQHISSASDPKVVRSTCWSQIFTHLHFSMVKLAVATSLAFFQLALFSRTSLALPVYPDPNAPPWNPHIPKYVYPMDPLWVSYHSHSLVKKGTDFPSSDTDPGGLYDHLRCNRDNHDTVPVTLARIRFVT